METKDVIEQVNDVSSAVAEFKKSVADDISELRENVIGLYQAQAPVAGEPGVQRGYGTAPKSFGAMIVKSDAVKAFQAGKTRAIQVPINLSVKNMIGNSNSTDSNGVGFNVQPVRSTAFGEDARRDLSLLSELPSASIATPSLEYHQLDSYVNASDYQLQEGDLKPEQRVDPPVQTAYVRTIAAYITVSEQVASDAPYLMAFLDDKLRFQVLDKLEAEIVGGAGGDGRISGIETNATAFGGTATREADRIEEAVTQQAINGYRPTHILLHPSDWGTIRRERATDGQYVVSDWATGAAPSMWGVPVRTSNSVTQGSALVIDASELTVLDRQSVNVQMGYADDDFVRNKIRIRCELRAGLAVFSPSSILQFDLQRS